MTELEDIKRVTIIGAGTMGRGIATVFAGAGYPVRLYSLFADELESALKEMRTTLAFLADNGLGPEEDVEAVMARVSTTQAMDEAVEGTQYVVECVLEDMALKQEVFRQLDELCSAEVVLATNTSVMSPTEIGAEAVHRERILGTHWWNPPFLIPLVEVVQTRETASWAVEVTMALHRAIGKRPVHCKKDVPGFIANRLQHALWREAISLVERGIADPQTVDDSVKYGPGLRWPVLGPLENADMVGLDLTLSIHNYVLKYLEDSHEPSPLLKDKVEKGQLGFKGGGAGFYAWTPEAQQALRARLLDYLVKAVKQHKLSLPAN